MNLFAVFATGLLTGGLTCMAVQGGLLTATLAQREEEHLRENSAKTNNFFPILSFLIAKLVAYTLLGFALGFLGSVFQLSVQTQVFLYIGISIFMIGTALNILNVHPLFRYFVIQPPKFLLREVRNQTKSKDFFAPALVGAFTIFIPCGTTQAMMALALGTGNPLYSAAIMFSFVLGTSPLFILFGILANRLNSIFEKTFMKVAAFAVIFMALFNINNAISLSGSKYTFNYFLSDLSCTALSICPNETQIEASNEPVKEATIEFKTEGYYPSSITVAKNSQVKLNLVNNTGGGCIQAFTIPKLNIQKIIRTGTREQLVLNIPSIPQDIRFTCSMGMYEGVIHVI